MSCNDENNVIIENTQKGLLQTLDIAVTESENRKTEVSFGLWDNHTVYLVESNSKCNSNPLGDGRVLELLGPSKEKAVWRRYSDFENFHKYLETAYPFIVIPPLPEKRVLHAWQKLTVDKYDTDFIDRRRAGLEKFLLRVAAHPLLSRDSVFKNFLQEENLQKVVTTERQIKKATSTHNLRIVNFSADLRNPNRNIRETKIYGNELYLTLSNLLKVRTKLADREYGIHKLHENYGRVFSEWPIVEKQMTNELQSAGHYMDVYSVSIDSLLDEEEEFIDQIKEYTFFAESLKCVCNFLEMKQHEIEQIEDIITSKRSEQQLAKDRRHSLVSKVFGRSTDSDSKYNSRFNELDLELKTLEAEMVHVKEEEKHICHKALVDIARFQQQKVIDLKEALICYIVFRIKMFRQGLLIWKNIQESFTKL
ncbi:sorting nexin-4-like [Limulus polyphemus]|uniref:Sorting nexin-4-like n=1 Tax=Limulus polyphemus TaxID=6850 RepID=A0ABM1BIV7_LIMPO|nr:sorting nexin-4-like [Limulus polyphemus]